MTQTDTQLWLLEQAEKFLTIEVSTDPAIEKIMQQVIGDLDYKIVETAQGPLLQVTQSGDEWTLTDAHMKQSRQISTLGDLAYFLSDKVVYHFANRVDQGHCLHAACVAKGDSAIVIPANSGHGKSSLTCWLVANGFDYVTDELIILRDDNGLSGIARPLQIKSHGLQAIQPLLRDESCMLEGDFANAMSMEAVGGKASTSRELTLRLFLFPHYVNGYGYQFQPLSSALTAMELMGTHVNARNLDAHGFQKMARIARATPAYSLKYGGFDLLPDDFSEQLTQLL